jgi:cation transporter-like permease
VQSSSDNEKEPQRRPALQFSLLTLFVVTTVVAVGAASLGGLLGGGIDPRLFLVFAMAAPLAMVVLVGVGMYLFRVLRRRR